MPFPPQLSLGTAVKLWSLLTVLGAFLNPSYSDSSLCHFLMAGEEEETCPDLLAVLQTRPSQTVNYVLCRGEI